MIASVPEQEIKFNTPIALNCHVPTQLPLSIRFTGDYAFQWQAQNNTLTFVRQTTKAAKTEFHRPIPNVSCEVYQGGEVTLDLASSFADGTELQDAMTGQVVTIEQGKVRLTLPLTAAVWCCWNLNRQQKPSPNSPLPIEMPIFIL